MRQKITFLLFVVFTSVLSAQTVTIQGGSSYGTIQEAIDASIDGDVILITGIHTESINIDSSITLRGTDPTTDIIQANAAPATATTRVITLSGTGTPVTPLNITIENLGVRHGNTDGSSNGGGIFSDKITGLLTLKNLIIENNNAGRNGGGLAFDGSNVTISGCTIRSNSSTLDGGGIIIAPNNSAAINNVINIEKSLLNGNTGRNGGGIWINGNNANSLTVNLNIENSTISNNSAFSPSSGNGGGAILSTSPGNVTLKLVHTTVYNNSHAAPLKTGLQFINTSTNFSAYNSIIVSFGDDVASKAINFANTNTTDIVNSILGGLNAAPALIDEAAKNNQKGKTANEAGLTGTLESLGGNTQVIAINANSAADDFCSASTGISIPTVDQRDYNREGVQDAGAFEIDGTLSTESFTQQNTIVTVFPNPARDYIKISGVQNVNVVKVYSMLGTLQKVIYNNNQINVSNLASGMYLMVIEGDGLKTNKRIIIE